MWYPGQPKFAKEKGEGEMKYTWKVIHEVVGKLEGALNAMQKDGFDVYRILPAGEMGTTLEMGTTFVVVGRKEVGMLNSNSDPHVFKPGH